MSLEDALLIPKVLIQISPIRAVSHAIVVAFSTTETKNQEVKNRSGFTSSSIFRSNSVDLTPGHRNIRTLAKKDCAVGSIPCELVV